MRMLLALVLLAAASGAARADDPPPPTAREVSYAYQTLACDGVAAVLAAAGLRQGDVYARGWLLAGGAALYVLGAPSVHDMNGHRVTGFKSFGMRIGLPVLGGMIGSKVGPKEITACDTGPGGSCHESTASTIGAVVGAGVGVLAAVIIDAKHFAHHRVEIAPQWSPTIGSGRAGWSVGVGGVF